MAGLQTLDLRGLDVVGFPPVVQLPHLQVLPCSKRTWAAVQESHDPIAPGSGRVQQSDGLCCAVSHHALQLCHTPGLR